jgi:hypothetical protein
MRKILIKLVVSTFCVALLAGCATIVRGTSQTISINSNIAGANIELDGSPIGTTPFSGKIKKKKDGTIKISKQGYVPQTISLNTDFDIVASGLGNVLIGGTTGTTTDWISGAAWMYEPNTYFVQLQQDGQSNIDYQNELLIRKFAMLNHSQIAIDAGKSGGEYTDALVDLMKSKMDKETATQSVNHALEKSKGDQIVFGNELIEQFRN